MKFRVRVKVSCDGNAAKQEALITSMAPSRSAISNGECSRPESTTVWTTAQIANKESHASGMGRVVRCRIALTINASEGAHITTAQNACAKGHGEMPFPEKEKRM